MAQKRMFSLSVVDTDRFVDMPTSTQALYFHLGMHGDDDGFVSSPRKIARAVGCGDDDMRILAAKGFLIPFESGVVVLTDWKVNNTLKNDRYKPTIYLGERSQLSTAPNGRYEFAPDVEPICIRNGSASEPQHNVTEVSLTEYNIAEEKEADKPPARPRFSPPSVDAVTEYCQDHGYCVDAERFVDYYESNGWMVGKNKMKDWKAAVRSWSRKENPKHGKMESKPLWTVGTTV